MFFLYNVLVPLLAPLWWPWAALRALRRGGKVAWGEKLGQYALPKPDPERPRVWFHAVSVGEVIAALPILRELRALAPQAEVVLTVTTTSGLDTARERAAGLYDHLRTFPYDVLRFQLAAMQNVRPKVVAVMETELWMNHLYCAKVFDAQTMVVNGRISDRSFRRSLWARDFYEALLRNLDRALMQTETDAERIRRLGARSAEVLGNTKFDQALEGLSGDRERWRRELGATERPLVLVGSIRAEEFAFLAEALPFAGDLVVAPRHLEKADELARALGGEVWRRSKGERLDGSGRPLLLDTYGELGEAYAGADVAVVGGGFADLGGQNLIQPMAHGVPVVAGTHLQNFRDVAATAGRAGALVSVETPSELRRAVDRLLAKPGEMGKAGQALVRANQGAARWYAEAIAQALD